MPAEEGDDAESEALEWELWERAEQDSVLHSPVRPSWASDGTT